jgi:serine/threonine protein kinase
MNDSNRPTLLNQYNDRSILPGFNCDVNRRCWVPPGGPLPTFLPPRLICEIVRTLITACEILQFGQVGGTAGLDPITHCDIKTDNIIIEPPTQANTFTRFILANYGKSFESHPDNTTVANPTSDNP